MRWVTINGTHVNANHIDTFYWKLGKLGIWFTGDGNETTWKDPDGELYLKMCKDLGVEPCMEDCYE